MRIAESLQQSVVSCLLLLDQDYTVTGLAEVSDIADFVC